jgi:guanosine-3',5'-bis(diphosphate) 3'-pyrophosphohydrolase
VAGLVKEVTDDKSLSKQRRKRLQVEHAASVSLDAQQIKLADKLCNLRDMVNCPPTKWPKARKRKYVAWTKSVVDQIRGANPGLAARFDRVHRALAVSGPRQRLSPT